MPHYLSPAPPRVFAHRGLALGTVENTAGAFVQAIAAGAQFIETDVHATLDGVAVLWHDPDLRRFDGSSDRIAQLTWVELSKRSVSGVGLLTFEAALLQFPGSRFNVDLKVSGALVPVVEAVQRCDAADRVLLTSFADSRRRAAAKLIPGIATSVGTGALLRIVVSRLWCGRGASWLAQWRRALHGAVAVQVPRRRFGIPIVTAPFISAAHALNVEVHVWTVNEPNEMIELFDMGVDGIVTDRCDLAIEVLRAAEG